MELHLARALNKSLISGLEPFLPGLSDAIIAIILYQTVGSSTCDLATRLSGAAHLRCWTRISMASGPAICSIELYSACSTSPLWITMFLSRVTSLALGRSDSVSQADQRSEMWETPSHSIPKG